MTSVIDRFRRWFEYEKDAHAKVVASLRAVPKEKQSEPGFQKAVDLLAHIAAARAMWLYRFGVSASGPNTTDGLFPRGTDLDEVVQQVDTMQKSWDGYLDALDDDALVRIFEYRAVEGRRFKNQIEEILTQLFGHSWYHRGQIASLVRGLGEEPAVTDFVFWSREKID